MNEERTDQVEETQEAQDGIAEGHESASAEVEREPVVEQEAQNQAGEEQAQEGQAESQAEEQSEAETETADPPAPSEQVAHEAHQVEPLPDDYSRIVVLLDCVAAVGVCAGDLDDYLSSDKSNDMIEMRRRELDSMVQLRNATMSVTAAPEGEGREAAKVARTASALYVLRVFLPEEPHDADLQQAIDTLTQTGNLTVLSQVADAVEVPELGLSSDDQIGDVLTGPQDDLLQKTEIPQSLVFDVIRCVAAIMACAAPAPVKS